MKKVLGWMIVTAFLGFSNCTTPEEAAVPPPGEPFFVHIIFGLGDRAQERWTGSIEAEEARMADLRGWRLWPDDVISLNTFDVQTMHPVNGAAARKGIFLQGTGPLSTQISVTSNQGTFFFRPHELRPEEEVPFLNGTVEVTGLLPVEKLTDDLRDDDYPSIVAQDENTAWAVWQSYSGLADEIRLSKYDENWRTFTRVPGVSGDVWRPQLALDVEQLLWVVWSQQVDGNFDLYARALNEETNNWQPLIRLSTHPHPDIDHHLISDSRGNLWVVWQGFHGDNSDIFLCHYDGRQWSDEVRITENPANDWEPRIAVDQQGRAHIVWDTYRNGNYDIYMRQYADDQLGPEVAVADTPRFEAHASVAVDKQDRVWVAWDEGGVNWAKDNGPTDTRDWLENRDEVITRWQTEPAVPGVRINELRQINLVVFEDNQRKSPAHDLQALFEEADIRSQDYPQLIVDPGSDRIALVFHRWNAWNGNWVSEYFPRAAYWETAVVFYEGDRWSKISTMPESWGRLSMRPSASFSSTGSMWITWPADMRLYNRPYDPTGNNIFVARLEPEGVARAPELKLAESPRPVEVPLVHPNEVQDVADIRSYRTRIHAAKAQIVRGDFHRHTELSWDVGGLRDGSLFDFYRYMLDAASMDFGAVTDHNSGGDFEYWWWLIEKSCDMYNIPKSFTTFYGYERSVRFPGGHRNIFHTRRGVPVVSFFTETAFNRPRPGVASTPEDMVENDTKLLYESLHETGGIAISHTSGSMMGTDWRDNDPEVEPVVEIFQGDRVSYEHPGAPRSPRGPEDNPPGGYQEAGFVWNAYRKGYRLGTITSSDHWSTHISYAMVYAEKPTREAIFEAIKKRHTYGATDNIILDYRMGRYFMGEEFKTSRVPPLKLRVIGTSDIAQIDIIKNEELIYSTKPDRRDVNLTFVDRKSSPGTSYYYVRVIQDDWEMAWGSPIWVNVTP